MPLPKATLALAASLALCLGACLNAPTRGADGPQRGARGITLSELSTFGNREAIEYGIMPLGEDFFVATYENQQLGGRAFNELRALRLYRYDDALRRSDAIDVAWANEAREHISITTFGNHFVWTYGTVDARSDEAVIEVDVLDARGGLLNSAELLRMERRAFRRNRLAYEAAFTPSRSHYARVYVEASENRIFSKKDDERAAATILVVDEGGAIVSNKRVQLEANRDQINVESVAVDGEGRAYVLAKVYANARGRERRNGGSDAKLFLYTLDPGAEAVATAEIELQGQYIEGVSMVPADAGAPAIVGLYADGVNREIAGFFSGADVRDGATLRRQPFTQQLLAGMGRKITRGRGKSLAVERGFEFRDALRLSDGRLSLLMESFQIMRSPTTTTNGMTTYTTTYLYGEGVILDFDAAGTLTGALVVPKAQSTQVPGLAYARMNLVEYEGHAAVLYNDNPKNFTRPVDKRTRPLNWRKSLAVLGYGEAPSNARASSKTRAERLRRLPLFARRDADKVIAIPRSATRLPDGRVVFLASRYRLFGKNELRFGVIDAVR